MMTLTHAGETLTPGQWEKRVPLTRSAIRRRKNRGLSDAECLTLPVSNCATGVTKQTWRTEIMNSEIALSRQWFTAKDIAKEIGRETHSAQTYVRGLADDERLETSREGGSAVKYRVRRTDKEIAVLRTSWRTFDNSELDLPSRLGAPW